MIFKIIKHAFFAYISKEQENTIIKKEASEKQTIKNYDSITDYQHIQNVNK